MKDDRIVIEITAAAWLAQDPLFLDTETTGLDDDAEIVEIAILNAEGEILLQELCRPSKPMAPEAAAVNKIDPAELDAAQPWPSIAGQVAGLLAGRLVICHNADYDARLIRQTCRIHNTPPPAPAEWDCTLQLLWPLNGERRPRLTRAMELAGAEYPAEGSAHRAAYDAECCRRIVLALAPQNQISFVKVRPHAHGGCTGLADGESFVGLKHPTTGLGFGKYDPPAAWHGTVDPKPYSPKSDNRETK